MALKNFSPFIEELVIKDVMKPKPALFATMALQSLQKDGVVHVALGMQENKIYVGPIKIWELPAYDDKPALLEGGKSSAFATQREKP
jgi:hypothetical protein